MALSFAGAYVTAESEHWLLVHLTLGYTLGGLVAFRILWGLMGTRYARFGSFIRGPGAVIRYGSALLKGKPEHHIGHNPAGAVAIVLLLLSSIATVATGWVFYNQLGADWIKELHEGAAGFMLAVVGVHLAGVVLASWLHRENLIRAMLTGKKEGALNEGIRWTWRPLALILLAAVLGYWWLQWQAPINSVSGGVTSSENAKYRSHGRDDD
jgi:cytochrome b